MTMLTRLSPAIVVATLMLLPASPRAAAPDGIDISATGQPTSWIVHMAPYKVTGYGHASFGMGVAEVKALIDTDFAASAAGLKDEVAPGSGVRTLTITVAQLAPGPGTATLNYVFGSTSQRLVGVNVTWRAEGQSTTAQRAALVDAAKAAASGLSGWKWPLFSSWRGRVMPDGALIVFSGRDAEGAGVEVRLDGADIDVMPRKKSPTSAITPAHHVVAPPGPAFLRLAFVADVDHPDAQRIPAGAF
jgi:hypothetical protein